MRQVRQVRQSGCVKVRQIASDRVDQSAPGCVLRASYLRCFTRQTAPIRQEVGEGLAVGGW